MLTLANLGIGLISNVLDMNGIIAMMSLHESCFSIASVCLQKLTLLVLTEGFDSYQILEDSIQ